MLISLHAMAEGCCGAVDERRKICSFSEALAVAFACETRTRALSGRNQGGDPDSGLFTPVRPSNHNYRVDHGQVSHSTSLAYIGDGRACGCQCCLSSLCSLHQLLLLTRDFLSLRPTQEHRAGLLVRSLASLHPCTNSDSADLLFDPSLAIPAHASNGRILVPQPLSIARHSHELPHSRLPIIDQRDLLTVTVFAITLPLLSAGLGSPAASLAPPNLYQQWQFKQWQFMQRHNYFQCSHAQNVLQDQSLRLPFASI